MTPRLGSIGLCVLDLAASRQFYMDVFGFEEVWSRCVSGHPYTTLMELETFDVEVCVLALGQHTIELVCHLGPNAAADPAAVQPSNTVGYTHLAIHVDDVLAMARLVDGSGGTALLDTFVKTENGSEFLYCRDPNGIRFELVHST